MFESNKHFQLLQVLIIGVVILDVKDDATINVFFGRFDDIDLYPITKR